MSVSEPTSDPQDDGPSLGRRTGQWLTIVLAVGLAAWIYFRWDDEVFMGWKQTAHPVPFFAALAILPAFGVPTTPFFLIAGATFAPVVSLAGSAAAVFVNQTLMFWIGRRWLRRALTAWLLRRGYRVPKIKPENSVKVAFLVKFTPGLPTFLKNYVLAIGGISFGVYTLIAGGVTFVYAVGLIVLGESLLDRDLSQAIFALVLLGVILLATHWVRRRLARISEANDRES